MAKNRFKVPITAGIDPAQLKSLIERIQGLDKRAGRAAIRKGMNEVTKQILATAREKVPQRSGLLKKALGRKVTGRNGGARIVGIVKPRGGVWTTKPPDLVVQRKQRVTKSGKVQFRVNKWSDARSGGLMVNPARYAHLVEFGRAAYTMPYVRQKRLLSDGTVVFGPTVRAVPAHPFMRPAWAENENLALPTIQKWLSQALKDYWAKSKGKVPPARRNR